MTVSDQDWNEDWLRASTWDLPTDLAGWLRIVIPRAGESKVDAVRRALELPSAQAMPIGLRRAVDRWLKAPTVVAAGTFDESKHPRDSHGRFGEGGGSENQQLLDAYRADAKPISSEMFATGEKLHGLVGAPNGEPTPEMATALKVGIAHDIAGNMNSSTEALCLAADVSLGALGNHDVIVWMETENGKPVGVNWDSMPSHPSDVAQIDKTGQLNGQPVFRGDTPEAAALLREDAVGKLVSQWAGTSNDSSAQSLAMQESAVAEFGLAHTATWEMNPPQAMLADSVAGLVDEHGAVFRDFLRAQYDSTQGYLKGEGITHLTVARGWAWGNEGDPPLPGWAQGSGPNVATVETRPLSSWTTRGITAASFASGPEAALTYQRVPADRILSIPLTGLGCLSEREVVVLGGATEVVVAKHAMTAAAGPAKVDPYDATVRNEDWIKTLHWDLPTDPKRFEPGELAALARLPAGEAMPAVLRKTLH